MLAVVFFAGSLPTWAQVQRASGTQTLHRLAACQNGQVMGWGNNANYVLAQAPAGSQYPDPFVLPNGELHDIAAVEWASSSSFAITRVGALLAWGDNSLGQLGIGSGPGALQRATPKQVGLPRPAVSVAAADKFTLVLLDNGSVWAWGDNSVGELGTGAVGTTQFTPVPTLLTSGITAIACGDGFGLALTASGQVLAWGQGPHGELGTGPGTLGISQPQPTPRRALLPDGVRLLTASATAAGAVLNSGELYTWGNNTSGQLGQGSTGSLYPTPAQVSLSRPGRILSLAVAERTMCVLLDDGKTQVWGYNGAGSFGICNGPVSSSTPVDGPAFGPGCGQVQAVAPQAFAAISPKGDVLTWGEGPTGYAPYSFSCSPQAPTGLCQTPAQPLLLAHANTPITCADGATTLYAVASQAGLTYTWYSLANPAVVVATGPSFTVRLATTTTFEVRTELPGGCPGPRATVTVTLATNCCETSLGTYTNLKNSTQTTYTPATLAFQPGARYLVADGQTLALTGGTFTLPVGATLLLGTNSAVELSNGAELVVSGATITAACDDMWAQILVRNTAVGVRTEAAGNVRSLVQHGQHGIVLEDAPAGGTTAAFRFYQTDFRHNQESISISRINAGATTADLVANCTFDSDPQQFKKPLKYVDAQTYYYSTVHILLQGDVRAQAWTGNTFTNTMFGILIKDSWGYFDLTGNTFRDCYVAGISTGDIVNYFAYGTAGYSFEARLTGNHFYLPKQQPATPQRSAAAGLVIQPIGTNSFGANLYFVRVQAFDNVFEQTETGLYANYDFTAYREKQIGINGALVDVVRNNTFRSLAIGINANIGTGDASEERGNLFTDCEKGISVSTRTFTAGAYPGLNDAVLYSSCNTFLRDATRPGSSYGIYREYYNPNYNGQPQLYIDDPAQVVINNHNQIILKDLFNENGTSPGAYFAIFNASGALLNYKTFADYLNTGTGYFSRYQQYSSNTTILSGSVSPNSAVGGNTCQWESTPFSTGIQLRPTQTKTIVKSVDTNKTYVQTVPNPCSGSTIVNYKLPATVRQARLLIRKGLDGTLVEQLELDIKSAQLGLNLHDYQPGLYFCTLVINGVSAATQRLLVK